MSQQQYPDALVPTEKQLYDKTKWPDGPWKEEPDRVFWYGPASKLWFLLNRNGGNGAWMGYVGVEPDYPFYRLDAFGFYDEEEGRIKGLEDILSVHGGITYSGMRRDERSLPNHIWWIGFDCSHAYDYCPGMPERDRDLTNPEGYKDIAYVTKEVQRLAAQIHTMATMMDRLQLISPFDLEDSLVA